ncbi:MAG: cyclophilin-like fold protein [Fusobacterium mortiferum]|nr:cyclophilin-like fold protein [Fusobacterium mortiferum]MCI7664963.1 cyclophilin-like fold protein [Fusobacterium mortiferum]MDY2802215.1 cyclophilin-like fold protein [Fusobacterium mortiferum]
MSRIRLTFNNQEIVVGLDDNSASRSLLNQLPLDLKFENYGSTEKISYLPKELDISNAPGSCSPKTYDLTYYSPWGNLAFFIKDFRNSNGLIPLGRIEKGFENLKNINNASIVKIERID